MTKWLRAEQNLEWLLIMPNISMRDWFREVEVYLLCKQITFKTTILDEIHGHNKYQIYSIKFTMMGE